MMLFSCAFTATSGRGLTFCYRIWAIRLTTSLQCLITRTHTQTIDLCYLQFGLLSDFYFISNIQEISWEMVSTTEFGLISNIQEIGCETVTTTWFWFDFWYSWDKLVGKRRIIFWPAVFRLGLVYRLKAVLYILFHVSITGRLYKRLF